MEGDPRRVCADLQRVLLWFAGVPRLRARPVAAAGTARPFPRAGALPRYGTGGGRSRSGLLAGDDLLPRLALSGVAPPEAAALSPHVAHASGGGRQLLRAVHEP